MVTMMGTTTGGIGSIRINHCTKIITCLTLRSKYITSSLPQIYLKFPGNRFWLYGSVCQIALAKRLKVGYACRHEAIVCRRRASPTALNWIDYFIQHGAVVHLVSSFPCQPPPGLASFQVIPVGLSQAQGEGGLAGKPRCCAKSCRWACARACGSGWRRSPCARLRCTTSHNRE